MSQPQNWWASQIQRQKKAPRWKNTWHQGEPTAAESRRSEVVLIDRATELEGNITGSTFSIYVRQLHQDVWSPRVGVISRTCQMYLLCMNCHESRKLKAYFWGKVLRQTLVDTLTNTRLHSYRTYKEFFTVRVPVGCVATPTLTTSFMLHLRCKYQIFVYIETSHSDMCLVWLYERASH